MKVLLVLVVAFVGRTVLADPISISNNNIGDIVKVDVEAEVDIKSEINVELVNVIAELLLELREVTVNICRDSSSSEEDSVLTSTTTTVPPPFTTTGTLPPPSSQSPFTTTGTLPPPSSQSPFATTGTVPPTTVIGPGTQTTTPGSTPAMQNSQPYQQLVQSLAQSKPPGYDSPGLTKEQKEELWRKHVEELLEQHLQSRQ